MTETTIEQAPNAPAEPPPTTPSTHPVAASGGVPGMPLLIGSANAVGLAVMGASAIAGPVGLVAVGAAGLAAGTIARRKIRNRTLATRAGHPRTSHTPTRTTATTGTGSAGRSPIGAGSGRNGGTRVRLNRAARKASSPSTAAGGSRTAAPSNPSGRTGRSAPGSRVNLSKTPRTDASSRGSRGAGLLESVVARRQAGAPTRAAKAADRTAKRTARGVAKAERQSGVSPVATARPGAGSPAQKKALRRSAIRHGARMAAAAGIAAGVGLLSGLWNIKRPGKATGHLRTVWRRLSDRARSARARRDAAIRGITTPGKVAVPAEQVNHPHRTTTVPKAAAGAVRRARQLVLGKPHTPRTPRTSGGTVSDPSTAPTFTRLSDAAEVMLQAASTFDPEHMNEFQVLIDDLPEAMGTVQETLRVLAELSDEKLPVNPAVVEELGEGYRAMSRVVDALTEVGSVYRRVHAEDIERNENPRNGVDGERRWNV